MLVIIFFFQAEDGIRDYKVTGVQTCALPICPRGVLGDMGFGQIVELNLVFEVLQWLAEVDPFGMNELLLVNIPVMARRSEERRVGKECGSRGGGGGGELEQDAERSQTERRAR